MTGRRLASALLTWSYPPVTTGIGRAAQAIATGLTAAGADVRVFSADRPAGTREDVDGVTLVGCAVDPVRPLGRLRRRAVAGHLAAPFAIRAAVLAEHRRRPFDVIESTNWYAPATLLPRNLGPPLVVRNSTPAGKTSGPAPTLRDRVDHAFAHRLERALVHRADRLIFNTRASADLLGAYYGLEGRTPTSVIGLALADDVIAAGAAAAAPDDGPLRLLFVGRAETRKGFDELIAAFAQVRTQVAGARLDLVGTDPGDARAAVARLGIDPAVLSAIAEHGRVDDDAIHRLLAACHMVVAPSRTESYGIVYREAAAFGRPLVAARDDASACEFVAATGAGILAERVAPGPIADAVLALWRDGDRRAACRAAGLHHAVTLTQAALGEATLGVYREAINSRAPS